MMIKTLTFFTLILGLNNAHAENHMLIMGGGGEPEGPSTIFDSSLEILGNNLKTSNWKYQASFNGGHPETQRMLASSFNNSETPTNYFTAENYNKKIAEYKAKILMGQITKDDQLMIIIGTHGAAKTAKDKTHQIAARGGSATNLNDLSGATLVNVDALEELVKLTNERGIKLGLIDLSCHSGSTLALKTNAPNTCIITASGPNHYAFAGTSAFSGTFLKNLQKGVTLERAFLKARTEAADASFPMISTDENNQIVAEVYSSITPYLYYYEPDGDKLTDYLLKTNKDCIECKRETQFSSLISKIEQLQRTSAGTKQGFNGELLKKLLTEYKNQQDELIKAQKAIGIEALNRKETFITSLSASDVINKNLYTKTFSFKQEMSWKEILESNPDKAIENFEGYRDRSTGNFNKAENQNVIDGWKKIKAKKEEIITQYPKLKNAEIEAKKIVQKIGENRQTAFDIALQEKKFYDELYRQKQSFNTNDPCRKIVF